MKKITLEPVETDLINIDNVDVNNNRQFVLFVQSGKLYKVTRVEGYYTLCGITTNGWCDRTTLMYNLNKLVLQYAHSGTFYHFDSYREMAQYILDFSKNL